MRQLNYSGLTKIKRSQQSIMRRFFLVALSAIILISFNSCMNDDDDYSLNNSWSSMGFIKKTGIENYSYYVKIDNGDTLLPYSSTVPESYVSDSQRVIVNYTILEDNSIDSKKYSVRINSLQNVLYKKMVVLTPENADSIGNDPVQIKEIWLTGKILNIEFRYYGGGTMHFINLVRQPGDLSTFAQPIELEFRHNIKNDLSGYPLLGIVSFDISDLMIVGQDTVHFTVKAKEYDNKYVTFTDLSLH